MRCLLDTHAFLWWIGDHSGLSRAASRVIAEGLEVRISAASVWEIAIKARLGRLQIQDDFGRYIRTHITVNRFRILPVELEHTLAVYDLPGHPEHRDPFDRLLAAQSLVENLPLVSKDTEFDHYGVERVW
ncbi:MAG: type II toxin-antitoxin system VapC family toxin [Gammaproteobacteria bacterium]|nr:type II toxin-antitoxin system VapC family toxin [Gammaproteobacteria bacterium]